MMTRTFAPRTPLVALAALAAAVFGLAPQASSAQLSAYSQNFETLAPAEIGWGNTALGNDGWLTWVNVFNAGGAFLHSYGQFAAPNGTLGYSGVAVGAGGPAQGNRQLVAYSNYDDGAAHSAGNLVETLVFQQRTVTPADVGTAWTFQFDAKLFNLAAPSTARAFIWTLDPNNGFQASASASVDMSAVPTNWGSYSMPFTITAGAGQILQFGFASVATNYTGSAVYYDNVSFAPVPEPATYALRFTGLGLIGLAARRRAPQVLRRRQG